MLAVEHISPRLESVNFSICTLSDYDFREDNLEGQILIDKLVALWESGCEEPDLYQLVSFIASSLSIPEQTIRIFGRT